MTRKAFGKVRRFIFALHRGDALDAARLGEDVRRFENESLHAIGSLAAGVDQRDRRAVAVTDENRLANVVITQEPIENRGLVMHVADQTRQLSRRRQSVAASRVNERAASGPLSEALRKVAPCGCRSESFVE